MIVLILKMGTIAFTETHHISKVPIPIKKTKLVSFYSSFRFIKILQNIKYPSKPILSTIYPQSTNLVGESLKSGVYIAPPAPVVYTSTPTTLQSNSLCILPIYNAVKDQLNNLALSDGYNSYQIEELDCIVNHESGFSISVVNSSSGAAGLFQALPFSKTGCQLSDELCQINWGLSYIQERYGNVDNAYTHEENYGWY